MFNCLAGGAADAAGRWSEVQCPAFGPGEACVDIVRGIGRGNLIVGGLRAHDVEHPTQDLVRVRHDLPLGRVGEQIGDLSQFEAADFANSLLDVDGGAGAFKP